MEPVIYNKNRVKELFNTPKRVYVLFGEDDRQKDEALDILRGKVIDSDFSDFDFEVKEADTSSPEDILSASGLAPFGSSFRLVIVRGAELYRRKDKQADGEKLAQGLAAIAPSSILALRVAAADDEKSRGKTILSVKLDKAISAVGMAIRCKNLSDEALREWVQVEADSAGKKIGGDAVDRLIASAHGERSSLNNELQKAICFVGNRSLITLDDVEAVCSYDPEDVVFKLVDSICARNGDRALYHYHELMRYDTKIHSVAGRFLALLARQFKLMWQARELSSVGINASSVRNIPAHLKEDLPSECGIESMAWKARDIYAQAQRWDRGSLAQAMKLMLECDLANKGDEQGSENVATNIELLIIRLCGK